MSTETMNDRRQFLTYVAGATGAAAVSPIARSWWDAGTSAPAPHPSDSTRADPTATHTKSITAPPPKEAPGTLLRHERIATSIKGAQAWRVLYVSRDMHGVSHLSSGLVIAPLGAGANRPIVTWCHGTTGLGDAGCPSAQPDPACELVTYFTPQSRAQIDCGVPGLQALIDEGWIVCATDYQGLGTPGMHHYEVNRTNARDAVYIVHAARTLDIGAGSSLGCMGWSQGGGAAAAVAELEADDYRNLRLVGVVAMSPGVSRIALETAAGPSTALGDAKAAPDAHLVMTFAGIHAANPTSLALSDMFTPLGVEIIESAWNNQPIHHLNDTIGRLFRLKGAILHPNPQKFDACKAAIVAGSAAARKPVAPILVCIDGFAGGTAVPVVWQRGYIEAVKQLGGTIEVREYPNDDHFSLPQACVGEGIAWLKPRM
jgi:hypothetical protein